MMVGWSVVVLLFIALIVPPTLAPGDGELDRVGMTALAGTVLAIEFRYFSYDDSIQLNFEAAFYFIKFIIYCPQLDKVKNLKL